MSEIRSERLPAELAAACEVRLGRLRQAMADQPIDAMLVNNEKDILYLTGFVGHDSLLLVSDSAATIIGDSRYDEYLDPWRERGLCDIAMGIRHRLHDTVATLCGERSIKRLGVQSDHLTLSGFAAMEQAVGGVELVKVGGILRTLRMRKDAHEIAAIEHSLDIHQQALAAALPTLRAGMTELEFCAAIEFEMKKRGAAGTSFDTMVCSGPNSSVIHHSTSMTPIEEGVLLIDCGVLCGGYCSDLTRTFGVGHLPEKMREIYTIVLEAQLAAIEACAPGRVCADVDAIARDHITKAGYGEYFGHGLGHGLGIDIHEDPYFNDLATDVTLEPGMVMTVEPGIYLPGVGGVRIEDDVLITDDGHRVLSDFPKDLDSAILGAGTPIGAGVGGAS